MNERAKIFLAYMVGLIGGFGYLFSYISKKRCFIRDGGREYKAGIGLDEWASTGQAISCYFQHMFTSSLVLIPIFIFGLIFYLVRDKATFGKVMMGVVLIFLVSKGMYQYLDTTSASLSDFAN